MIAALLLALSAVSLPIVEQTRNRNQLRDGFPEIGALTFWDRLAGWCDLRCVYCTRIVGNGKPAGGSWQACGECVAAVDSKLRQVSRLTALICEAAKPSA